MVVAIVVKPELPQIGGVPRREISVDKVEGVVGPELCAKPLDVLCEALVAQDPCGALRDPLRCRTLRLQVNSESAVVDPGVDVVLALTRSR